MTQLPIINLGVIGLGPDWESRYAPAVKRLSGRCRTSLVYDPTTARAEDVAQSVDARAAQGIRQFLAEEKLNAVLLLQLGWQGDWLLEAACRARVPVFLGKNVLDNRAVRDRLDELLLVAEEVLVPEQPVRYFASMLRLHELMATQLGPVQRIHIDLPASQTVLGKHVRLSDWLSWCCVAFRLRAESASCSPVDRSGTSAGSRRVVLPSRNHQPVELEIQLADTDAASVKLPASDQQPFCRIVSDNGQVDLIGPRDLRWDAGAGEVREELQGDRSAIDVTLDLFARRAAGGLVPVPDLHELRRGAQLASLVMR